MKHLRLALVLSAAACTAAYAQDEERRAPPTEIPDFSNLDEYIYEPKSTVTFGVRYLGGAKVNFSGSGSMAAREDPGPETGTTVARTYHDGAVQPDARGTPVVDEFGQPVFDAGTGQPVINPITPDGKSNTWNYVDDKQRIADGRMAFHTYSADIIDTTVREGEKKSTMGMELAVHRDMGNLFGTRMSWRITAGMALNDISATNSGNVLARITTTRDIYEVFGAPPDAPYSAPTFGTENILDANGQPVLNEDGTNQTRSIETTVLIGNQPLSRQQIIADSSTAVSNRWKVKGSYFTFRAGPTLWVPISTRLRASVSVGGALVYAGTSYTVTETFTPETGAEFSETESSDDYKLLPGFYVDATLQYDLTERAGFYAGAVYQSAGDYSQEVANASTSYTTKIDLAGQSGVRAGMSIRF